jgi:hypothetical protein
VQVAVDAVEVPEVQLFQRVPVTLLRPGDELFNLVSFSHRDSHPREMPVDAEDVTGAYVPKPTRPSPPNRFT